MNKFFDWLAVGIIGLFLLAVLGCFIAAIWDMPGLLVLLAAVSLLFWAIHRVALGDA